MRLRIQVPAAVAETGRGWLWLAGQVLISAFVLVMVLALWSVAQP